MSYMAEGKTPKSDQLKALREVRFARDQEQRRRAEEPIIVTPRDTIVCVIPPQTVSWSVAQDPTDWSVPPDTGSAKFKKRGRPKKTEAGFDKAAWQKEYMRKRREKAKS